MTKVKGMTHTLSNTAAYAGEDLDGYFGLDNLVLNEGAIAIKAFADNHLREVTLSPDLSGLSFSTEDVTFEVTHDLDQNLEVCFHGRIISYCPETVNFESIFTSIYTALTGMKIAYDNLKRDWRDVNFVGREINRVIKNVKKGVR